MVSLKSKAALDARWKLLKSRLDDPDYHFHNTQERHAERKAEETDENDPRFRY